MQIHLKRLLIAGTALVVVIAMVILESVGTNDEVIDPAELLAEIYSSPNIEDRGDHYLIDSKKEVYPKTILVGDSKLFVVAEKQEYGGRYRFYTTDTHPKLLKEAEIFGSFTDNEEIFTKNFFEKDITGDGVEELFIKMQVSGNNLASYEVFQWENRVLANLKLAREKSSLVSFDEINNENGHITMTWHAVDAVGKTWYELNGTELTAGYNVGFFNVSLGSNRCEVRVNKVYDEFKTIDTKTCDSLGMDFNRYYLWRESIEPTKDL